MSDKSPSRRPLLSPVTKTVLGIVVSVVLLAIAALNVDFSRAWEALSRVNFALWALTMLIFLSIIVIRSFLVMTLLSPHGKVSVRNALPNLVLGYFCNNILPLKVGELIRTGLITREASIPFLTGLSALVMERSMDILALLVMALVSSFYLPLPQEVTVSVRMVGGGLLALYMGVVALAALRRKGWPVIERLLDRLPGSSGGWLLRTLDQLAAGLVVFSRPAMVLRAVVLVTVYWSMALLAWHLRFLAFGITDSFVAAPFVVLVVGLGISVPSAPSYAGVMHACIVFALAALGVSKDLSFPFAVFLHAVDFLFIAALGVAIMAGKSLTLGRLRAAARSGDG